MHFILSLFVVPLSVLESVAIVILETMVMPMPVISGSLIMFLPEIILWGSWASSLPSFRKELSNERFRNRKKNCTSICLRVRCNRHPRNHGEADVKERKLTGTLFPVISGSLIMFLPEIILWGSWASSLSSFRKELSNERFRNRKKTVQCALKINSGLKSLIRGREEVDMKYHHLAPSFLNSNYFLLYIS